MELFRHPKLVGPGTFADDEPTSGVFLEGPRDELRLLDMPSGVERRARLSVDALEAAGPAVAALLDEVLARLRAKAAGGANAIVSLRGFAPQARRAIADVLGLGEVEVRIMGDPAYAIEETALAGLWRAQARDDHDRTVAEWLEVGEVPAVLREAVLAHAAPDLPVPTDLPAGCMNVGPLLHELKERVAEWRPGVENHVVSFTLFPMTPEDMGVLGKVLGVAPIDVRSKGYGSCRIVPTRRRHVWGVQYLNVMDTVILDTLEVGDVPAAVLAGQEDFEDSVARLGDILDACLPDRRTTR